VFPQALLCSACDVRAIAFGGIRFLLAEAGTPLSVTVVCPELRFLKCLATDRHKKKNTRLRMALLTLRVGWKRPVHGRFGETIRENCLFMVFFGELSLETAIPWVFQAK
jgi:hypothetical protein